MSVFPAADRSVTGVLAAMCLGTFMAILDTSLVNLGLHSIQADLHADMSTLQWVIDLYNLAYAALILTGGTLADLFGRRRIFLAGTAMFALGSAVCALAPDAATLIIGRGIAGLGAAFELPAALAILNIAFPDPRARARAIAIWGGMNGLAMAVGPTLGGVLVDAFGWRSLFYAVLPVAAATAGLAIRFVPETRDTEGRGFDFAGQGLAIAALATVSLAFIEGPILGWSTPVIIGCLVVFGMSTLAFCAVEYRSASPMVPLAVFGSRPFSVAIVNALLMTFGMYGLLFVLPLFFQGIQKASATMAGLELLPMSIAFFVVSPFAGEIAAKTGARLLIAAGMSLVAVGMVGLAFVDASTGYLWIALPLGAVGIGLGFITGPIATVAVANAAAGRSGMSSGLVNMGRLIGATLGVAVLGIVFGGGHPSADNPQQFMAGLHVAFVVGAVAEFLGVFVAVAGLRADSLARHESGRA